MVNSLQSECGRDAVLNVVGGSCYPGKRCPSAYRRKHLVDDLARPARGNADDAPALDEVVRG